MTKEQWLEKNGFAETGVSYLIGGSTYEIKDWLKEQGCKYNPILQWHSATPISELPQDYFQFPINYTDIMEWSEEDEMMLYLPSYKETIKASKFRAIPRQPRSEYYPAAIGDKIQHITAVFESSHSYLSKFGKSNIYTFTQDAYCFVWFTQTEHSFSKGDVVDISFTLKGFEEYRDRATTLITRCKIVKI